MQVRFISLDHICYSPSLIRVLTRVLNLSRKGDFVTCSAQGINGILSDGGYAEYVTLRSEASLSIPEDIDPAECAPLLCAGVTTFSTPSVLWSRSIHYSLVIMQATLR